MRPACAWLGPLLVCLVGAAADRPAKAPTGTVLLFPGEGVPFRLRLEMAGPAPAKDWDEFLDRLFDHFDRDGDGALSRAEAARIVPLPIPGDRELLIDFGRLDADRDGKGSRSELKAFCRGQGFAPVVLTVSGPGADDDRLARLFLTRLDANGDGKLSAGELRRAPRALRKYDLNEDETLDLAELLATAPAGREPGPARLKADSAGEADAMLRIDLGARPAASLRGKGGGRLAAPGDGVYRLRGPGGRWWLTFRAERAVSDVRSASAFLVSQFKDALGDNPSLTKAALEEDATLACFLDLFPYADRDGDGRLSLAELEGYLRLVEAGMRAQVWARAADRGHNPFPFLDRDGDGRLSCREQLAATDLLGGKAERAGLPAQFEMSFGGPPVKSWGGVAVPGAKRPHCKVAVASGPAWFQAMDRNGDGVVSRAEFLGPPALFRELDADGDGILSTAEAIRAGAR